MRTIITGTILALSLLTAACGGDDDANSCAKVVDHIVSLVPDEARSQMGDKKQMIEKCEKETTPESRECALKARSMEDFMQCPRGK